MAVIIQRKNGSDGVVTINYKTVELDKSEHTATANIDFEPTSGTLTFNHGETEQAITIKILPKDDEEHRDECFGL